MTFTHGAQCIAISLGLAVSGATCARPPADVAVTPVPLDLDSAAVARWVGEQGRVCTGVFEKFIDEAMVAPPTPRDSVLRFHYAQRVTGVRCTSGK